MESGLLITWWFHKIRMDCSKNANYCHFQKSRTLAPGINRMDSVHVWPVSWVTWIRHDSDGSSPPVVFIVSHMYPSCVRWIHSIYSLYHESHESSPPFFIIKSHIYLSWVTWTQSTSGPYRLLTLVMNLWVLWTVHWLSAAQGLRFMELYFVVVRPILLLI